MKKTPGVFSWVPGTIYEEIFACIYFHYFTNLKGFVIFNSTYSVLLSSSYPRPRGRRVQYLVCVCVCVCVCLSVCYHKIAVNFNYLKI